jgi:hypothetical protein
VIAVHKNLPPGRGRFKTYKSAMQPSDAISSKAGAIFILHMMVHDGYFSILFTFIPPNMP